MEPWQRIQGSLSREYLAGSQVVQKRALRSHHSQMLCIDGHTEVPDAERGLFEPLGPYGFGTGRGCGLGELSLFS